MPAKRLAVVEDITEEATAIQEWLEQAGYEVCIFELLPFRIDLLRQFAPDLVILDIYHKSTKRNLGYDILKEIRADSVLNKVKVMVFTEPATTHDDKKKAMHYKANFWYEKVPADILELYVRSALEQVAEEYQTLSFYYNPETMERFSYGKAVTSSNLPPLQKRLIDILWERRNKPCSFEELIGYVYQELPDPYEVENGTLTALVGELRRRVPEGVIENVWGFGFKLVSKRLEAE